MGKAGKYKLVQHKPSRAKKIGGAILVTSCVALVLWWFLSAKKESTPQSQTAPGATSSPPPAPISSSPVPKPETSSPATPAKPTGTTAPTPAPQPQPRLDVFPRPAYTVAEAQIALARQGISSGSIDGLMGSQTRSAIAAFQREQGLTATGEMDDATKELLILTTPSTTRYLVTSNDLARLQPVSPTWFGKSQQTCLDFENILELVAETHRAHPNYIRRLNPGVDWAAVHPGTAVTVPDSTMPVIRSDAAFISIFLSKRLMQVFDSETNLMAHYPCSIAQRVDKRPVGELYITAVAPDPNYTFDPEVFPESPEAQSLNRKLILPPGPNNPVGVVWISLDRSGYGIHGTPMPEQVGRTESHGCFRLANWNAMHLLKVVRIGMRVYVEQ